MCESANPQIPILEAQLANIQAAKNQATANMLALEVQQAALADEVVSKSKSDKVSTTSFTYQSLTTKIEALGRSIERLTKLELEIMQSLQDLQPFIVGPRFQSAPL